MHVWSQMTKDYVPPVNTPELGAGELSGGYREWCLERMRQAPLKYSLHSDTQRLFSILVPVHNPADHWLQECIDSVRAQTYPHWELILVDDASQASTIQILQKNAALDARIKISLQKQQSGISTSTNCASEMASGEFLVFLDHDDLLDAYALTAFAQRLLKKSDVDILYADEDRFDKHYQRLQPGFKPQFSKEKLLCTNYIHHPVVIRGSLFKHLGGLDRNYDGSQDYDLLLRAIERTDKIEHIADVLYHMRIHSGSLASGAEAKPEAHDKGLAALKSYLQRQKITANIYTTPFAGYHNLSYPLQYQPKISILLLAGSEEDVTILSESWQQHPDDEILVCHNIKKTIVKRLNALADQALGDVLIFADGRLRPEPGCINELVSHCLHKSIGLVTGKLIYSDDSLHSCGLVLGTKGSAGRWHYACGANDLGYGGWMGVNHEVSAVSWQLMAVKKEYFFQVGQFNEDYIEHGFDVHFALQLTHRMQLRHLAIVRAKAYFSDVCPQTPEYWSQQDFLLLWSYWQKQLNKTDPFYHPSLSIYDEGIHFIGKAEIYLKDYGVFMGYDKLTYQLIWQCFNSKTDSDMPALLAVS